MNKGLTSTIIFKGQSLNYGEGTSNISELKKLTRGDGSVYTYASRQCLRYDIVRLGHMLYDWNLQVVDSSRGTIQFKNEATIETSEEMDLFGYMKTSKKSEGSAGGANTRSAAVRLSNAISLEPYRSDMDLLTNKGFADRINEHPNLANIEQHLSFYTYTITIDLNKIGVDGKITLDNSIRAQRINEFLDIVKILNREIRGRQENLSPLFIIGGIYDLPNPFFMGRIKVDTKNGEYLIETGSIIDTLDMEILGNNLIEDTYMGIVKGVFGNESELISLFGDRALSIEEYFRLLKDKVNDFYGV
ncbi:MAG TPA: type I-B CRISPR-associated protein Cas7/Cst2/DevR [Clostridiales bacterium]|nr:type I-B CRISPR-associated protein Cas7/Cst2/DevR [Clostridiales bacterium]